MLTTRSHTNFTHKRYPQGFLKATQVFLLVTAGLLFAVPGFADDSGPASTTLGGIVGTVTDANGDPIPGATVELQGPASGHVTDVTKDDGSFALGDPGAGAAGADAARRRGARARHGVSR